MLRQAAFVAALTAGVTAAVLLAAAQQPPDWYHAEAYGDPPFLKEDGWRPLLNGHDLSGWRAAEDKPNEWFTARAVTWRRIFDPTHLTAQPEPGDRIVNGRTGKTVNLVTANKFGDFELYLEFLTAKGSNSGVYLHGIYEVQIFDSYGFPGPLTVGDCGGIYEREDGTGGAPPRVNAARPPGEWQSLHIWFQGPRFDDEGRKRTPAKVLRVVLNGTPVQDNVAVPGPTRSHLDLPEAAENPIMLQGDHSAIAYRNIYIKSLPLSNRQG